MSAARTIVAVLLLALGAGAWGAGTAAADLGPIQLVSADAHEQADSASLPAISADGRYVAFQGSLGGTSGVFRKDLSSGAVALVAGGPAYDPRALDGADASAPSISADGRYVSFTTNAALDPTVDQPLPDGGETSDVYVRDMALAPDAAGAYTLASAVDGSTEGLSYDTADGSVASARVSLSADGREVAFVVNAVSDLAGPDTPAGQVAVRDLDARRTTLVSARRDPQTGAMTALPVPDGAVMPTRSPGTPVLPGAALSADGTTVAWLGAHVSAQVPVLSDEASLMADDDGRGGPGYDEPLWRRIADGPQAPTRRVVGAGDPLAPGCPPDGTLADAHCQGPYPDLVQNFVRGNAVGWLSVAHDADGLPQLSGDGRTVALIGNPTQATNVFLVDMHDGLTRRQAVAQLTREVPILDPIQINQPANVAIDGEIYDIGMSADGRRIAFVTARTEFPLAPPYLVGDPLGQIGVTELYRIDLDGQALERITRGPGGGPSLGPTNASPANGAGASAPSLSADGRAVAFASEAFDLVSGDANGASDAFAVADTAVSDAPGTVSISSPPPPVRLTPRWRIAVSAAAQRNGSVRFEVVTPGAGTLRVRAGAVLRLRTGRARHVRLTRRQVASVTRRPHAAGVVALTLKLTRRYAALARSKAGLDAGIAVGFTGKGGRPLKDELDVTFRVRRTRKPRG